MNIILNWLVPIFITVIEQVIARVVNWSDRRKLKPKLTFVREPVIEIFNDVVNNFQGMNITYNKKKISNNIIAFSGYLVNRGSKDISTDMIDKDTSVCLPIGAKLLDSKIIAKAEDLEVSADQKNLSKLVFKIGGLFKKKELFHFRSLVELDKKLTNDMFLKTVSWKCRISGLKKITTIDYPPQKNNSNSKIPKKIRKTFTIILRTITLVLGILSLISISLLIYILIFNITLSDTPSDTLVEILYSLLVIILFSLIFGPVFWLTVAFFVNRAWIKRWRINRLLKPIMDVPTHLRHKPILVVNDYDTIDGENANNSDYKGLSIGKAQWDNNAISAKAWRHPEKSWSGQSEELPLHRVLDLTLLILSAYLQGGNGYQTTFLKEKIHNKQDFDLIKNYINNNPFLKERILALKSTLKKVT